MTVWIMGGCGRENSVASFNRSHAAESRLLPVATFPMRAWRTTGQRREAARPFHAAECVFAGPSAAPPALACCPMHAPATPCADSSCAPPHPPSSLRAESALPMPADNSELLMSNPQNLIWTPVRRYDIGWNVRPAAPGSRSTRAQLSYPKLSSSPAQASARRG